MGCLRLQGLFTSAESLKGEFLDRGRIHVEEVSLSNKQFQGLFPTGIIVRGILEKLGLEIVLELGECLCRSIGLLAADAAQIDVRPLEDVDAVAEEMKRSRTLPNSPLGPGLRRSAHALPDLSEKLRDGLETGDSRLHPIRKRRKRSKEKRHDSENGLARVDARIAALEVVRFIFPDLDLEKALGEFPIERLRTPSRIPPAGHEGV